MERTNPRARGKTGPHAVDHGLEQNSIQTDGYEKMQNMKRDHQVFLWKQPKNRKFSDSRLLPSISFK
jgi:hypothetical protein